MVMRSSRSVAWIGFVTLWSWNMACAQTELSLGRHYIPEQLKPGVFTEPFPHENDSCIGELFPEPPLPPRPSYPIDFCKELVIVDPRIIGLMPQFSFQNVMKLMLDTIEPDTDAIMQEWADTWKNVSDNDDRIDISQRVFKAWKQDRIKLIAVVNRLDVALAPGGGLGEGRLVYQVAGEQPEDGYLPMTFILEFDYPKLDPAADRHENLVLWAEKWHRLGTVPASASEFATRLQAVVGEFALSRHLRRIRSNEAWGNVDWAFREHRFSTCEGSPVPSQCRPALTWSPLRDTPLDALRDDTADLLTYLKNEKVREALRQGTHDFNADYDSDLRIELDWVAETGAGPTWVSPKRVATESMLWMAFNTCNGCHADFKTSHDVLPHIGVQPGGNRPFLSQFMTREIFMRFPLAGCNTGIWFGCGENGDADARYSWNEQKHRVYYLFSNLRANQRPYAPFIEPLLKYRYH